MELEQLLKDAGLTQYEAAAYYCLIAGGVLSANEISRNASIPMGKIYETLKSLGDKGFIEVQNSRPKKYHPVKPKAAFAGYYQHVKKEKDKELGLLQETITQIEQAMPEKRKVADDEEMFWTTTFGTKEMEAAYISYFMQAESEICIITSRSMRKSTHKYYQKLLTPMVALVIETAKKGTRFRILDSKTGISEICADLLESIRDKKTRDEVNSRITIREKETDYDYVIADDDTAILDIGDPIAPGTVLGTFKICDRKFNSRLRERFDSLWES